MPKQTVKEFKEQATTRWKNTLDVEQSFIVFVDGPLPNTQERVRISFKPGEEKALPSYLDGSIWQLDKHTKVIVGGLAPRLTKVGDEEHELHPCLDVEAVKTADDAKRVAEAMLAKQAAEIAVAEQVHKTKKK